MITLELIKEYPALLTKLQRSGIKFKTDKRGKRSAWYFCYRAGRKFRLALDVAEILVASGQVDETSVLLGD